MPSSFAFLPWVSLDHPVNIGPITLLPYVRTKLPGDFNNASQGDLDGVLAAYALRKDTLVNRATILEIEGYRRGDDSENHIDDLFRARELIGFSALANRRLFQRFRYCNFDAYALVVQRYQQGQVGAFSFSTRRRDGGNQYLWDTEAFTFLKPLHVEAGGRLDIDENLLLALCVADAADALPFDAIVEFNRANTDSADMPAHIEVVMMKSAFEWLFSIGNTANEFVDSLNRYIPAGSAGETLEGPLVEAWVKARPKATRRLEAWAREFCAIRGSAAHGKKRGGNHFVWSEHAHLAFSAMLFPLLVKRRLSQDGFLSLNERDAIQLEWIEAYLATDPFSADISRHDQREHPWSLIYSDHVLGALLARKFFKSMDAAPPTNEI